MKLKIKYLITIFFIILIIISSIKVNAILPKSISEDIWIDGEFEGIIYLGRSEGEIIGELNHGRSSTKGVFQATISINNQQFEAKGWFKNRLLYGTFKKDGISFPLIGQNEIHHDRFKAYLQIPNGFIKAKYISSYLLPIKGKYGIGVKEYHLTDESRKEILTENTEDFREIEKDFDNFSYHLALSEPLPEDNWDGPIGFIHQVVLDNYLSKHPEPEEIEYYLCGPPLMLQAVQKMLDELGVPEENIAFDDFGS